MIIRDTLGRLPGTGLQQDKNVMGYDEDREVPVFEIGKPAPLPHPKWQELVLLWNFLSLSYDGGSYYKRGKDADGEDVFIPHEHESEEALKRRRRISCYRNFCKPICDRFNDMVFGKAIKRDSNPAYQTWTKSVDDENKSLHEFMKHAVLKASIYGRFYVTIDSSAESDEMTKAQAEAAGVEIKLRCIKPQMVIDWEDDGSWFLLRESPKTYTLVDDVNITEAKIGEDGNVKSVTSIPHGWVNCPIVMVTSRCDKRSLLSDVAELAKCVFNSDSILREEICRQTFSQWWAVGVKPDDLSAASLGSRKVICVNPEGRPSSDVRFERMSGDSTQAQSIRETIQMDVSAIFQAVGLKPPDVEQTSPESGRALRIRNIEVTSIASAIADEACKAECKINELYAGASQMELEDPVYPSAADLEMDDASVQLNECLQLVASTLPVGLKTLKTMKYIKADFPNLDEAEMAELEMELHKAAEELESTKIGMIAGSDTKKEMDEHPQLEEEAKRIKELKNE